MSDPLASLDAIAQAELVRTGKASPLELLESAIVRIEKLNPTLNAVIYPLFEKARAQARSAEAGRGAFCGVPFLLKDLVAHSSGDPYSAGMSFLKRRGWRESEDTFLVQRLRAAGFVIAGKTNTPELGLVPTTEPVAFGPTHNPWDTARSPGGSSGGSAAATASGMVAAAHANDGGGSIRIPASMCGLVGLKPSRGRVSQGPDAGEGWAGFTAEFVVTRSVRDAAGILDAVAGPMVGDPYVAPAPLRPFSQEVASAAGRLRIGILARAPRREFSLHADCAAAVRSVGVLLESLGHRVEESHPAALDDPIIAGHVARVIMAWTARDLDVWRQRTGESIGQEDVEPLTWEASEMGRRVSASEYIQAVEGAHAWTRAVAAWWEGGFDLLLSPTLGEPPPLLGEFAATPEQRLRGWARSLPFVAFTQPFNVTGQPAISLPLYVSAAGLPIGVQLVAAYGREDLLLRVAAQLEAARPWAERRPPVYA
ncbi:MAG TPA: amidase [Myxococcota bacterium]|nr:amidase [Myxococcota bacterium]